MKIGLMRSLIAKKIIAIFISKLINRRIDLFIKKYKSEIGFMSALGSVTFNIQKQFAHLI